MGDEYFYKKRKRSSNSFSHFISPRETEGPLDKYLLPNQKKKNAVFSNG